MCLVLKLKGTLGYTQLVPSSLPKKLGQSWCILKLFPEKERKKAPWLRERIKTAYLECKKVLCRCIHYIADLQAGRGIKQLVRAEQDPTIQNTCPAHYSEHMSLPKVALSSSGRQIQNGSGLITEGIR